MFYVFSLIGYLVLAAIIAVLFGLSIFSSFTCGYYLLSILKSLAAFFLVYEIYNEWKSRFYKNKKVISGKQLAKEDLYNFLFVLAGSVLTYLVNHGLGLGAVVASCIIGIIGALAFRKYQVPIYCGSFAGMVGSAIVAGYPQIILVGIFSGILYVMARESFNGFGGKLGATAFFGTLVSSVILGTFSSTMAPMAITLDYRLFIYLTLGAAATFLINEKTKSGAVLASALPGLAGALLLPLFHGADASLLAVGLFCGTFIGMSAAERLLNLRQIVTAGVIGALIFSCTQPFFNGLGGKLGALAFGSSIASAGLFKFIGIVRKSGLSA